MLATMTSPPADLTGPTPAPLSTANDDVKQSRSPGSTRVSHHPISSTVRQSPHFGPSLPLTPGLSSLDATGSTAHGRSHDTTSTGSQPPPPTSPHGADETHPMRTLDDSDRTTSTSTVSLAAAAEGRSTPTDAVSRSDSIASTNIDSGSTSSRCRSILTLSPPHLECTGASHPTGTVMSPTGVTPPSTSIRPHTDRRPSITSSPKRGSPHGGRGMTTRSLSVLVAEDNSINQKLIRRLLTKMGHTVTMASDGRQAVDIFKRGGKRFDIVLMDICMRQRTTRTKHWTRIRSASELS
jgi:CheY-like chemotaxis protein